MGVCEGNHAPLWCIEGYGAYSIMFFSFYPVDYVKKLKLAAIVAAVK